MNADQHPQALDAVREALHQGEHERAARLLAEMAPEPADVRSLFGDLPSAAGLPLLHELDDEAIRNVLLWLPPEQSAGLLAEAEPRDAARWVARLPSDERIDLLSLMDPERCELIQAHLPAEARAESARLLRYAPDSAGGLMETELLAHPSSATVRDVIRDIRSNQERYAALGVQYLYVVDEGRRLVGVAQLRDLLMSPEERPLDALVSRGPAFVRDTATTHELADLFDAHAYHGLPVLDENGVLLGAVSRADVIESEHHESEEQYRVSQGIVGGEELRSMPVLVRVRRRGVWLAVNLVLCLGGAAIIAARSDTIAKALVVAAVLPVVSAMSGNAAMQAAAVTIRELALGVIEPRAWRRVLLHELALAGLLALPLGLAVAVLSRLWGAPAGTGLAVGIAMAANTLFAVSVGAVCPLVLRRLNIDPALASGPISTTFADISGFALTLSLVSLFV